VAGAGAAGARVLVQQYDAATGWTANLFSAARPLTLTAGEGTVADNGDGTWG
jgi:hypothetical protein